MKRIVYFSLLLVFFAGCGESQHVVVDPNQELFDGWNISKAKIEIDKETGDTLSFDLVLSENTRIQGIPCRKGWIDLDPDLNLTFFQLDVPFTFRNVALPAGTWVRVKKDYFICTLPKDVVFQGYPVRGNGEKSGAKGFQCSFFNNGQLKTFYPPQEITIQGVPCRASVLHPVTLHSNGMLERCQAAKDFSYQGQAIKAKSELFFNDRGELLSK